MGTGPMTNVPQFNVPQFNDTAAKLRAAGYTVINPAELDSGGHGDEQEPCRRQGDDRPPLAGAGRPLRRTSLIGELLARSRDFH